ncbi:MAG TPA: hypothetical protein VGM88_12650 [Kofleriaceae bacterium]
MRWLAVIGLLLLPRIASAADSSWLVCKGVAVVGGDKEYVVASILEHRGDDGASRDLDVVLLKGANVAKGDVLGKRVGDVTGRSVPLELFTEKKSVWKGTIAVPDAFNEATLDGRYHGEKFHAKLSCEVLDDLGIGH